MALPRFLYATRIGQQGRLREAAQQLQIVVEMDPQYSAAWNNLGAARYVLGDRDGAERAWLRSHELQPRNPMPPKNLGMLAEQRGDPARALGFYRRYLEVASVPDRAVVERVPRLEPGLPGDVGAAPPPPDGPGRGP